MKYEINRKCPKCGGAATTEYNNAGYYAGHLIRKCICCGYIWFEEPLDLEKKDE